jgi:general secretion pathway protein C
MNIPDNPTSQPSAGVDLSSIRQEALSNPQKLMDVARPSPAIIDGKFIGFRVQPGRKRKAFRQLGFRPNDIITEVNGIVLDDASKGAMVLGELSQASSLSVTVKRGSQEIVLPSLNF